MYQHIISKNQGGVLRISLNRPNVHHALNQTLIQEITKAFQEAYTDETIRVVLLTAEGDTAFCSGADLKETNLSGRSVENTLREFYNPMIRTIRNLPKPVVCKLNGLAVGAGASLALSCDMVIAAEHAYLAQMFVQIGLMPDAGASFVLPRLVGSARAFEMASTGRKVSAKEASQIGLISQCVAGSELDDTVEKALSYYRSAPTKAIGAMKLIFNESFHSNLEQMLELEAQNQQILSETEDVKTGITAFLKKEKPDYQGK